MLQVAISLIVILVVSGLLEAAIDYIKDDMYYEKIQHNTVSHKNVKRLHILNVMSIVSNVASGVTCVIFILCIYVIMHPALV